MLQNFSMEERVREPLKKIEELIPKNEEKDINFNEILIIDKEKNS